MRGPRNRAFALASPLPPSRTHKVAHAEVAEERQHCNRHRHLPMSDRVPTPLPAQMHHGTQREHCEQPEEDTGDLQPQHPAKTRERLPSRPAKAPAAATQPLACSASLANYVRRLMGRLTGRSRGCGLGYARRRTLRGPRSRCACIHSFAGAAGRGTLRCGRFHCGRHRLHRLSRTEAKRSSKANRIHPRSVAVCTC